jgi:hypothetical protein
VLAAALSFVLLTFGTAIGLSATSPWPLSAKVITSLAVFWVISQQIGSLMAGGYVAGRIRYQVDAVLDTMLRSTTTAQAAAPGSTAPTTTATRQRAAYMDETRAKMTRILASSIANGSTSNENRTYLAQLVAQRTDMTQQDAERRVDDAVLQAVVEAGIMAGTGINRSSTADLVKRLVTLG